VGKRTRPVCWTLLRQTSGDAVAVEVILSFLLLLLLVDSDQYRRHHCHLPEAMGTVRTGTTDYFLVLTLNRSTWTGQTDDAGMEAHQSEDQIRR